MRKMPKIPPYLGGYPPPPNTPQKGICKVPPYPLKKAVLGVFQGYFKAHKIAISLFFCLFFGNIHFLMFFQVFLSLLAKYVKSMSTGPQNCSKEWRTLYCANNVIFCSFKQRELQNMVKVHKKTASQEISYGFPQKRLTPPCPAL